MQFEEMRLSDDLRMKIIKLKKVSPTKGISILIVNYLILVLSIYICYAFSFWFYFLSIVLIGSVQRVLANLLHEGAHRLLSPNKKINNILSTYFTAYPIIHLLNPYKKTHLQGHHPHCGDEIKDPDYNFQLNVGLYKDDEKYNIFFLKNIVLSLFGYRTLDYIKFIYKDRIFCDVSKMTEKSRNNFHSERKRFLIFWVSLIILLGVTGNLLPFLLFWIIPLFTTYATIGWLAEMAEHYPLPESEKFELLVTRNRHGNIIENFLFGRHGDRYHLVHHLFPFIPCYRLKEAHQILLQHEGYKKWDKVWGGIFFRTSAKSESETLLSYTKKYRAWKKNNSSESFAMHMINQYNPELFQEYASK